jgi:hypothetical protein
VKKHRRRASAANLQIEARFAKPDKKIEINQNSASPSQPLNTKKIIIGKP